MTTDTLLADLADVLDRASRLAAQMAETLAAPPSYWPERNGTLGELVPGDRVAWEYRWREVRSVNHCAPGRIHIWFTNGGDQCAEEDEGARIQKRHGNVTIPDDPLREYRLPGGRVAYQEEAARWVEGGDWVQAVHGDEGRWEQVVGIINAETQTGLTTRSGDPRYGSITRVRWWGHDDKVRVATAPVPDPEPFR